MQLGGGAGLVVEDLHKAYDGQPVLRGVELQVPTGGITAVLGPSGCGKTTLLRIVAGFTHADHGRVTLSGNVLEGGGRPVPPERRLVGIVPQEGALFPHLTVAGNVSFGIRRHPQRRELTAAWLERVGLGGRGGARPHELSGGQQQRVALARALAPGPKVVLLDEPFSSLDTSLRDRVRQEIVTVLRDNAVTAVLVTHDQEEALSTADDVAVMFDGRIAEQGTPVGLYRTPRSVRVARFVGALNVLPGSVSDGLAVTALGRHDVVGEGVEGVLACRPEQLGISPGDDATVVGVTFLGAEIALRLRLDDGTGLEARVGGIDPPALHTRVGVKVTGPLMLLTSG